MQLPGLPSLLFLAYVLLLLPLGARRVARQAHGQGFGAAKSREEYWLRATFAQSTLLVFAWVVGSTFGYRILETRGLSSSDVLVGLLALAICYALRLASRAARSEEELRTLAVYRRAPRTGAELVSFTVAVLVASVAEEAAYRGVGWSILWYSLGNVWAAGLVMAVAFALAHSDQGWKSGLTIFGIAVVMHGLVAWTETLLLAMAVHALYDLIVGHQIRRQASELGELASERS